MVAVIGFIILPLFMLVAAAFGYSSTQRIRSAWQTAARELGLMYTQGSYTTGPTIEGTLTGFHIFVDVEIRSGGNNREKYTRVQISYPPAPVQVRLTKQGSFSFVKQMFGGRDLQIGDPGFDSRVVIDASDERVTNQFLSPARRMAVLNIFERYPRAEVTERSVQISKKRVISNPTELVSTVRLLLDKAIIMSAPTDVDIALEVQERGDLRGAADRLHEINAANTVQDAPNSFTQLLEAEALVSLGDQATAHEVLAEIDVGPDVEVDGWKSLAAADPDQHAPSPPQDAIIADPPVPASPVSGERTSEGPAPHQLEEADLSAAAVIADLFSANRMGFETEQHFLDTYAGRTVRWSGEVEKVRAFQTDLDFPGSGMKTTVLLGNLGDGRLVSSRVHAIVHLPPTAELERGQSITFTGTLLRLDRYMRNLFVAGGSID